MRCQDFLEEITTLAEGGAAPEAARHVEGCAACAARLAELKVVVRAARLPGRDARPELIARAKGLLVPRARPRLLARLLGSSLAGAGARAARVDDFALHVGTDELSVHLRFTAEGEGWRVAGRAPDDGWTLVADGGAAPCVPGGRFRLSLPNLDEGGFVLQKGDLELEVPPARALLDGGRIDRGS